MTTPSSAIDFQEILRTLAEHEVDFIVVGGVAAVLQGAPINTFDLDVVHSRASDNLDRLLKGLLSLEAYYRGQGDRRIVPNVSYLASAGHQLLMTRVGALDVLGTVGAVGRERGYGELLPHTEAIEILDGVAVRILDLATVIALKEEAGRDKDRVALPVLRQTLEERNRRGQATDDSTSSP